MTKSDAIKLLLDVETTKTPPEKMDAAVGLLARILREMLEDSMARDTSAGVGQFYALSGCRTSSQAMRNRQRLQPGATNAANPQGATLAGPRGSEPYTGIVGTSDVSGVAPLMNDSPEREIARLKQELDAEWKAHEAAIEGMESARAELEEWRNGRRVRAVPVHDTRTSEQLAADLALGRRLAAANQQGATIAGPHGSEPYTRIAELEQEIGLTHERLDELDVHGESLATLVPRLIDAAYRQIAAAPLTDAERRMLAQRELPVSGPPTDHEGDITRLLVTFDLKLDLVIVARITLDGFRIASEDIVLQNGQSWARSWRQSNPVLHRRPTRVSTRRDGRHEERRVWG